MHRPRPREADRLYAHGYPRGALYQVEPLGELHDRTGTHDPYPSWGVEAARVLRWRRLAGLA